MALVKKVFENLNIFLFLFAAAILFINALTSFVSASEFWPLTLSGESWLHSTERVSLYFKPVFYFLLSLIYLLPLDNQGHLFVARAIFGILSAGTVLLFIKWTQQTFKPENKRVYFFVGLLLIASPLFFSQVVKIRSDILVLFFTLLLLKMATVPAPWTLKRFASVGLLQCLLVGTTPRGLCHALLALAFLAAFHWETLRKSPLKTKHLLTFVAPYFFGFHFLIIFRADVIQSLFLYYRESYSKSAAIWGHFSNWIYTEPFLLCMVGCSSVLIFISPKFRGFKKLVFIPVIAALMSLAFSDLKTPYLIASFFPFLILPLVGIIYRWPIKLKYLGLMAFCFICSHFIFTSKMDWWTSNQPQRDVINKLEAFLNKNPTYKYFDGLGILPRSKKIISYIGPNDIVGQTSAFHLVVTKEPEVILYTGRMELLGPSFLDLILSHYRQIGPNIFLRNDLKTESKIELKVAPIFIFGTKPLL